MVSGCSPRGNSGKYHIDKSFVLFKLLHVKVAKETPLTNALIAKLKAACKPRGARKAMAIALEVSQSMLSNYLSGNCAPSSEVALRMVRWVATYEATKKGAPARVRARAEAVTQPTKHSINEKRKPGRKDP